MKKILLYIVPVLLVLSSCTTNHVVVVKGKDKPKGWYKNSHNPHHPMSTNPGHSKKRGGTTIVVAPGNHGGGSHTCGKGCNHGKGKGNGNNGKGKKK